MAIYASYPATTKHINTNTSCLVRLCVAGATPGNTYEVTRTTEGQSPTSVASGTFGSSAECFLIEMPHTTELVATDANGNYVGDKVTVTVTQYKYGKPNGSASFILFCKPGVSQEYRTYIAAENLAKGMMTSQDARGAQDSIDAIFEKSHLNCFEIPGTDGLGINTVASLASSGVSGTGGSGSCCGCNGGGTQGRTSSSPGSSTTGQGAVQNAGPSAVQPSRGLPLLFTTVHTGTERYKGPWGWYRTMGIYRKLFEQDPVNYYGHVSILKQDGTRASYLNAAGGYQSASGNYDSLVKNSDGWFERTKEGIYYKYNSHGNLKAVFDPNRNQHYYLYNDNTAAQKLLEIKCDKGLRPYFEYNDGLDASLNTRLALRDPLAPANNKYMYFLYDQYGYMTKAVGPEGCQWYFEYDKTGSGWNYQGKLTKVTNPDNYDTTIGYDSSG